MNDLNNHAKIFYSRLEQSWNFYLDIEKEVLKKISDYNKQLSDEGAELFPEFVGFQERYKGLLREGLLIQLCSLFEYSMIQLCKQIISNYEGQLKRLKKKKIQGNWLIKHLILLGKKNIDRLDGKDVLYFSDLIQVRNCFVHSNGIIHKYKYSKQLEKSVHRLQKHGDNIGTNIVQVSEDGCLLLGPDALSEVFVRGESVMEPVFEYAFQQPIE